MCRKITGILSAVFVALSTLSLLVTAAQNVQTINGVAIANVQTVNGVAKANVASVNGVDNTSGSFTPTDFANLASWLDADDSTTLYDAETGGSPSGADGVIGRWLDKSANANVFEQSTNGLRPLRRVAAINGKDAVDFDGTDDSLRDFTAISLGSSYTLFFVVQRTSGTGYQAIFNVSSTYGIWLQNSRTNHYISADKTSTAAQSTGTTYVITVRVTSGAIEFFLNGVADGTNSGASAQNWSALGYNGGGEYYNGLMGEKIVYNAALSDTDKNTVENYLATKWQ